MAQNNLKKESSLKTVTITMITGYKPQSLFTYFEEISSIPRSSGNEKAISDYIVSIANKHNLPVYQDEIYNVIIKKPASFCNEKAKPIVLQGHMDMVCEKNFDTIHDFANDPIKLEITDDKLTACGTTLGADNGIAVAIMLALLTENTLIHPPLECVFTTQEETGLTGAIHINADKIDGRTMINLDSEEEGVATVSCAGGMRARLTKKPSWEQGGSFGLNIKLFGLIGGHSGMDIDKERGNSNKQLSRILYNLLKQFDFRLASFNGGNKDNAIPREAQAELLFNDEKMLKQAVLQVEMQTAIINKESAEKISLSTEIIELKQAMSKTCTTDIINCLYLAPNGIKNRNAGLENFVIRSVNMGVVKTTQDDITIIFAPRSSIASLQDETKNELQLISELFSFEFYIDSEYPGFKYEPLSPIREIFKDCYKEQSGKELQIESIHAGLECGIFCEKLWQLDVIAVGPTINDCHTPNESINLPSCERFYSLICAVLKKIT